MIELTLIDVCYKLFSFTRGPRGLRGGCVARRLLGLRVRIDVGLL
jgi:hypothetical protein